MKYVLIILLFASCRTASSFVYAPVKITTSGSKIHVQPLQKFKPMPDTTVYGVLIKRN